MIMPTKAKRKATKARFSRGYRPPPDHHHHHHQPQPLPSENLDTSTISSASKFGSVQYLPEHALQSICKSLLPSHLSACARVSKTWSLVFTKFLWTELHVADDRPESVYKSRSFKQALAKHGHHIRILKMNYYGPLESFFIDSLPTQQTSRSNSTSSRTSASKRVVCTQLEHLELEDIPEFDALFHSLSFLQFPVHPLDEGSLVRFLQQTSSTLHTFHFSPFPANRATFLRAITDYLPELKTLSLVSTESMLEAEVKPDHLQRFLERLPPHVEELTLRVSVYDDAASSPDINRFFPLRPELFTLSNSTPTLPGMTERTLAVKNLVLGGDMSCGPDMLNAFIRRCPHLESLNLQDLRLETFRSFAATLKRHCPKLNELWIGPAGGPTDDLQLGLLIGASVAGLKQFSLQGVRQQFRTNSALALRKHFKTLEWLELPKGAVMQSLLIRDLLVGGHAPKLKYLDLMGIMPGVFHFHTGLELDADDLLVESPAMTVTSPMPRPAVRFAPLRPLPWTCLNLVYLRIKIHNFPRVELLPPALKKASDMFFVVASAYGPELQRAVLGQIGRLIHLEELAFGNEDDQMPQCLQFNADGEVNFDERYSQVSSLSLSLEHGLCSLAPLKKLRFLDVTCMAHNIGSRELSWMKLNWPKLERIDGLLQFVMIPPMPSAIRWLRQNSLGWVPDEEVDAWSKAYEL